jgi:hypothetical protein
MFYKIKLILSLYVKNILEKKLRHYLWPKRLHSRMFDFNNFYKNEDLNVIKRVNIGAGPYFRLKGWASADFLPNFKSNDKNLIHIDLSKNPDFLPFSNLEAIYTSHTLEHFNINIVKRLLKAFYNSLNDNGFLRIVIPDAELILDRVRNNDKDFFIFFNSYFKNFKNYDISLIDHALHTLSARRCRFTRNSVEEKPIEYQKFISLLNDENITNENIITYLNNHNFEQDEVGTYHLSCYSAEMMITILKQVGFKTVHKSAFMQSRYNPMRQVPIFDGTHPWFSLYIEAAK